MSGYDYDFSGAMVRSMDVKRQIDKLHSEGESLARNPSPAGVRRLDEIASEMRAKVAALEALAAEVQQAYLNPPKRPSLWARLRRRGSPSAVSGSVTRAAAAAPKEEA